MILILAGILLVYGGVFVGHKLVFRDQVSTEPTVSALESGKYQMGVQFKEQTKTLDEYVHVLAEQVRIYNEDTEKYWPNNEVKDQYILAESIEKGDFWLISPQGEVTELTKKEAQAKYSFERQPYRIGFGRMEGEGISGMYAALSEKDLNNFLMFENFPYLGTYDVFITYTHELFHMLEQPKWNEVDEIQNASRSERRDDVDARVKRDLLQKQLTAAIVEKDESLVKDAIATWLDYKEKFPEDQASSVYFDRAEGTAHYFEIKACMYASYPEQIKTDEDFQEAMALYASHPEFEKGTGTVTEGYTIGALSCVLLDKYGVENWQERLMTDGSITALDILAESYTDLPAAQEVTQADIDDVAEQIADFEENNPKRAKNRIFTMLYQLLY